VSHDHQIAVRNDVDNHRYVLELDGERAGMAVYHVRGGRNYFVHTEVDPGHEGEGLGSALAQNALDDVRARGQQIVPLCPFITAWLNRHPDYQDLIDQEALARINQPR
jgi:predicted GNAT family acetyltransferase